MAARWLIAATLIIAAFSHRAQAVQQMKSLYTVVDLKSCTALKAHADGDAWLCRGLPDYPVYLAAGALKTYLSVGSDAEQRRAAHQTLASDNTLFEGGSERTTIEWRFVIRDGKPVPFATIVRYFTHNDSGRGEVLVITRVTDKEACHVAHIDAIATQDAIVLARRIADNRARAFNCASEPTREGAVGKSPM
jgi:hypothetical protein